METKISCSKIARILRVDKDVVINLCRRMEEMTGKKDVLDKIYSENLDKINEKFKELNLSGTVSAFDIYDALIDKVKEHDRKIFELFKHPSFATYEGAKTLIGFAMELADVGKGYFLKHKKAIEFLKNQPPQNILKALNYKTVDELLEKEDLFEIYSALRFVEERDWLNNIFFKQYENVSPSDFEERKLELRVLSGKWLDVAETFLKKKYHNVSHLKELGIIFVIPQELKTSGETMRLFALVLHYLNEVNFYSGLFLKYSGDSKTFANNLISSLRGDVLDERLPNHQKLNWMIVQRYLAKDDEFDWRLFESHVNPEAIHWANAENNIARLAERFPDTGLGFWKDLDFIGDYYKTETGVDILISFNLIDTTMALVKEKQMIKYLYHHQEALWNKIFQEFVGKDEMMRLIKDNFIKGYITL